jgi:hypothetical protein
MIIKSTSIVLITVSIFLVSCQRDPILTNPSARLNFSVDTVFFDTVFTTFGSATKHFMIYNHNKGTVKISSIILAGGSGSAFKINVDGNPGPNVKDIEIRSNDSAYVFVQVLINPAKQNAPLLVLDSMVFDINGNEQNVKLAAWGQDVHLIKDSILKTQTWQNDKPYLIYDIGLVDSLSTLTIKEGTKIFLHKNALLAVKGTIIVNGTLENPVVFRGDRLDYLNTAPPVSYDKLPSQWNRILLFNSSTGNKFNYAEIRNGDIGLQVGDTSVVGHASVELSNCKIENHTAAGILAINSKIDAYNCLLDNCGTFLFGCWVGGEYNFNQCTFANYFVYGETSGIALFLSNYHLYEDPVTSNKTYIYGDLKKANFGNCIIFGDASDEVNFQPDTGYQMNYVFNHCLIKGTTAYLNVSDQQKFIKTIISDKYDPGFKLIDNDNISFDFQLTKTSIARDVGDTTIATQYPLDFFGKSRFTDFGPDLGAFEYIGPGK